ncbi:MAG TPA: TMEM175 family protein [Kofleriaceae bacterium]|jgi:uncharacterized membrane protein
MTKGRLEAFSDGVIAIIITIMVLELHAPEAATVQALAADGPVFLSYLISFVYVGIYWNNHHHMLHASKHVNGAVLWTNLHLLFWLSLIPFVTRWVGAYPCESVPAAAYGVDLFLCGFSWLFLQRSLAALNPELAAVTTNDWKGTTSAIAYLAAIGLAFVSAWISYAIYVAVAILWFVPDRRFAHAATHVKE